MRTRAGATAVLMALLCGCRAETPLERGAREFHARQKSRFATAAMETKLYAKLPDSRMTSANRRAGLGLAIRPSKTTLQVGEPLTLHLAYENFMSRTPVSATTCQGFSLTAEEETKGMPLTAELHLGCSQDDPFHDNNVELRHGQLRTLEVGTAGTPVRFDRAGRYLVFAQWQSFRPAEGMFPNGSEYALIQSNQVLITVK